MNFSRFAFLAAVVGTADAFTFRAEPCTLTFGQDSVLDMVSSYLDNLSGQSSFSTVREPAPPVNGGFQTPPPQASASAMGSYLDALAINVNTGGAGVSMGTYLENLHPHTHLNKPVGSTQAMAGYLENIPISSTRSGGAGLLTYIDNLGGQPVTFEKAAAPAAPAPAAAAPAAPAAKLNSSASSMSAYDAAMRAMAAAAAPKAPAAPAASAAPAAPVAAAAPVAPKALGAKPVASNAGIRSFTDMVPITSTRAGGPGINTHVDVLPIAARNGVGSGIKTHVDILPISSTLQGGRGLPTHVDLLGSTSALSGGSSSSYSAPVAAAPAQSAPATSGGASTMSSYDAAMSAMSKPAAPANAELGRGFAAAPAAAAPSAPKPKKAFGGYLDSL